MDKLSVIIPTFNVEKEIEDCLESVKWTHEILIIDMGSTDKTLEICKKFNAKIIHNFPRNGNFDLNRKLGMEKAEGKWILKLDSDERLTTELQRELKDFLIKKKNKFNGYNIYNKIFMFGKEIKHGFVKPNSHELRLVKKGKWIYNPIGFHQQIRVKSSKVGFLENKYIHINYSTIEEFIQKMNRYTELDSKILLRHGKRTNILGIFLAPIKTFSKLYFLQKGFLDGVHGLVVCILYGFYNFIEKAKVWEYQCQHAKTSYRMRKNL